MYPQTTQHQTSASVALDQQLIIGRNGSHMSYVRRVQFATAAGQAHG